MNEDPVSPQSNGHERQGELADIDLSDLLARAKEAKEAASLLSSSASDTLRFAGAVVKRQLEEHPVATLGVAAGVGFVVAGGLASPAARTFVRTGARIAIGLAIRQVIVEARRRQGGGAQQEGADDFDDLAFGTEAVADRF
jgi:ElaB/YqjD/DUF883 family membrane-anchored ribosome-binding protein